MKSFQILIFLSLIFISCQSQEKRNQPQNNNPTQSAEMLKDTLNKAENNKQSLVLTFDALQLVDQISGSSNELPFGTPQNQLIEIINNTFQSDAVSIDVNPDCGAGPLKMVTWNNGLTLVFQENNTKSAGSKIDWLFQGWSVDDAKDGVQKLTTMAGIGIGSTLDEIQSAYEIEVRKTSLGYEFSTAAGMYGILEGTGKDAKITHLWSGVSCNFR
ncbi:MAG: hypothetical protein APF83_08700 [Lutibacter sp. BRH_c52]|nr:MAG: hypothetical protein APF83_08700 [Lutibacter sp. BRH_c52]